MLKENSVDIGEDFLESCLKVSTRRSATPLFWECPLLWSMQVQEGGTWSGEGARRPHLGMLIHRATDVAARLLSFPGKDFLKMTQIF